MKRLSGLVILGIILLLGCRNEINNYENIPRDYSNVSLEDWLDPYLAETTDLNYSDNLIYNECLELYFEYEYSKAGKTKYYKNNSFREWQFIDRDTLDSGQGIKYIKVTSINPNENYNNQRQSSVTYEYLNANDEWVASESTGVVENHRNIVLHNTRSGFFLSLFSFPWPSVKFPIAENPSWNWKFAYSSEAYGDDRLFNWEGITQMNYVYNYIGEETLKLKFGKVETSKFEAVGTDGEIENKLIYNFNSKLGFVKQIFKTHDGAEVKLIAVDYKNRCNVD